MFWYCILLTDLLVSSGRCGNGKNLTACRTRVHGRGVGFDFSVGLLDVCRSRAEQVSGAAASISAPRLEVVVADVVNLPVREGAFDAALSIAVLHHISSVVC